MATGHVSMIRPAARGRDEIETVGLAIATLVVLLVLAVFGATLPAPG